MVSRRSLVGVLLTVLLVAAPAAAQDASESRDLDAFTGLVLKVPGDVELSQGDEQSVRIEAVSQEMLDKITTVVRNGELVIDGEWESETGIMDWLFGGAEMDGTPRFYITMTEVTSLRIDGTGDIEGQTTFTGDALSLRINGTGDMDLDVDMSEIDTRINGTGDVEIRGRADSHSVSSSGTGDVEAGDLVTRATTVRVSGVGDCTVNATESLDARTSGVGDIRYFGNPSDLSVQSNGVGSVESAD
jgi:hypothetical protein